MYISGKSRVHLRYISGISLVYLRHILGIYQANLKQISSISQAYLRCVSDTPFSIIGQGNKDTKEMDKKNDKFFLMENILSAGKALIRMKYNLCYFSYS